MLEFLLPLFHCFQLAFPLIVFTIRCGLVVPFQICDLYLERLGFSFHHTNKGTFLHSAHATRLMTGFFKNCCCSLQNDDVFTLVALKALPRMAANHSSVLYVDWSSNARATGKDTWLSTQA